MENKVRHPSGHWAATGGVPHLFRMKEKTSRYICFMSISEVERTEAPKPLRRDAQERRDRLLAAARREFAARGGQRIPANYSHDSNLQFLMSSFNGRVDSCC